MSRVVLLTGPAGSGKSTAAALWAARGDRPRAVIDVDSLRLLIRAGVALPEHGWTRETERQWNIGTDLWVAMARVYRTHEVDCVVDVYAPPPPDKALPPIFAELRIQRVILLPTIAVCLHRNRTRNRRPLLSDEDMRKNYEDFEWCVGQNRPGHVVDNTDLTAEQTVDAIEAELTRDILAR